MATAPAPHQQPGIPMGPFDPDKSHSDPERWICIYPAYINKRKTRFEGRLVNLDLAIVNPHYTEIRDVLISSGFTPIVENKQYPRERSKEITFRGRIRVQIKNQDGKPLRKEFPDRLSVLKSLCEKIPQLKTRNPKTGLPIGQENQQPQQQQPQQGAKKSKKKK